MNGINCPVCTAPVGVRATRSARGKTALMLACPRDGRHFRAFINDVAFVSGVLAQLEDAAAIAPPAAPSGRRRRPPTTTPPFALPPLRSRVRPLH